MDGTILGQGSFVGTGNAVILAIPSGVDWLNVYNFTAAGDGTTGELFRAYWQRGMPNGQGIGWTAGAAGAVTVGNTANNSFRLYDPSVFPNFGALNNGSTGVTGFTAAEPAVVTVGSTAGMAGGNVVRFNSLNNQPQFNGIDFTVAYNTLSPTTFSVDYLDATGTTPSTSGAFYVYQFNPLFYPRRRTIATIIAGNPTVIGLTVDHGYTVGQEVRLSFPGGSALWGPFANLDASNNILANGAPLSFIITAVDTLTGTDDNTITINANTTGFTFPAAFFAGTASDNAIPNTALPFSPAQVVPIGEDTATALSQVPPLSELADATFNTGFLGMTLAGGDTSPAGAVGDLIFWTSGKSTFGGL